MMMIERDSVSLKLNFTNNLSEPCFLIKIEIYRFVSILKSLDVLESTNVVEFSLVDTLALARINTNTVL
jgi:hypothetical protein